MSDYSQDFEDGAAGVSSDQLYRLKLSIDIRSAKNFKVAANVFVRFTLQLQDKFHQFKSESASPIRQGAAETKLGSSFATYEFFADKAQLGAILNNNSLDVALIHHDGQREVGSVRVPLKILEQGEQKKTVSSMVIVSDKFLEVTQAS